MKKRESLKLKSSQELQEMNKSPQYIQQTEPKHCKSDVEEICIHQNLETGPIAVSTSETKWWVLC